MSLYVDSASLMEIAEVARAVPLAGVTTNPTILLAAQQQGQILTPAELLAQLLQKVDGQLLMQPSFSNEESAYLEALAYIEAAPERVIPKIPATRVGMLVARRLKAQGARIAFTDVTTVSQAYTCALTHADFIIPYYNRMARSGVNASERVSQMARVLREQQLPARIMAASIKSSAEAAEALLAGAHDLTVAPQVLLEMVTNPESEHAVEKFEQDWQKLKHT